MLPAGLQYVVVFSDHTHFFNKNYKSFFLLNSLVLYSDRHSRLGSVKPALKNRSLIVHSKVQNSDTMDLEYNTVECTLYLYLI